MNHRIKEEDRKKIADGVFCVLADSYVLYLKTQNYHWNVTGVHFGPLHSMFQEHYENLAEAVDTLAERIRALGHKVNANFSEFTKHSALNEETGFPSDKEMLKNLLLDHEAVIATMQRVMVEAQEMGDEVTTDMLIERSNFHEKTAWMIRSHLE